MAYIHRGVSQTAVVSGSIRSEERRVSSASLRRVSPSERRSGEAQAAAPTRDVGGAYQLPPTQAVLGGLLRQVRVIVPFARRLML